MLVRSISLQQQKKNYFIILKIYYSKTAQFAYSDSFYQPTITKRIDTSIVYYPPILLRPIILQQVYNNKDDISTFHSPHMRVCSITATVPHVTVVLLKR